MEPLLYEIEHGIGTGHFMLYERDNHVFPMHMHRCFEFVLMISGQMDMHIEKQEYLIATIMWSISKSNLPHTVKKRLGFLYGSSADMISNDKSKWRAVSDPVPGQWCALSPDQTNAAAFLSGLPFLQT